MCGIAGIFKLDGRPAALGADIGAMTRALAHRGPDDEGFCLLDRSSGNAAQYPRRRIAHPALLHRHGSVVHGTDRVLPARSTHALRLVVETGVGAVVYFLLAHLANLGPWRRMLDRLREAGGVRGVIARWVTGRKSRGCRP